MSIFYQKLRLRWLTNANEIDTNIMKSTWPRKPNLCVPNVSYIPRAHAGSTKLCAWSAKLCAGSAKLCIGSARFALGPQGFALAFWIPTCWYQQSKCLAFGILPNANPQKRGVSLRSGILSLRNTSKCNYIWMKIHITYFYFYSLHTT